MFNNSPILTTAGLNLFLRALGGEDVTFTRFKIGDGTVPSGTSPVDLTDLISTKLAFPCAGVDDTKPRYLTISGHFSSADVADDFRLRELGLFAKGEDNIEKLYCYINDGDGAGTVKAAGCAVLTEQEISLVIAIGEATTFSVELEEGILYAKKSDFDAHVADENNPHGVTAAQAGAAPAEHTHSAADIASGVLLVEKGGTGESTLTAFAEALREDTEVSLFDFSAKDVSVTDLDTLTTPGIYYVYGSECTIPFTPLTDSYVDAIVIVYKADFLTYSVPGQIAVRISPDQAVAMNLRLHQLPLDQNNWTTWM